MDNSNETIYIVITVEGGQFYQYIFVYESFEYWGEEQEKLAKAFKEATAIEYQFIDIRPSDFIRVIPHPKKEEEGWNMDKKKNKKYVCPDCGKKHTEDHHPPYCWGCIARVTGV